MFSSSQQHQDTQGHFDFLKVCTILVSLWSQIWGKKLVLSKYNMLVCKPLGTRLGNNPSCFKALLPPVAAGGHCQKGRWQKGKESTVGQCAWRPRWHTRGAGGLIENPHVAAPSNWNLNQNQVYVHTAWLRAPRYTHQRGHVWFQSVQMLTSSTLPDYFDHGLPN